MRPRYKHVFLVAHAIPPAPALTFAPIGAVIFEGWELSTCGWLVLDDATAGADGDSTLEMEIAVLYGFHSRPLPIDMSRFTTRCIPPRAMHARGRSKLLEVLTSSKRHRRRELGRLQA